jgi:hypothetical protein
MKFQFMKTIVAAKTAAILKELHSRETTSQTTVVAATAVSVARTNDKF